MLPRFWNNNSPRNIQHDILTIFLVLLIAVNTFFNVYLWYINFSSPSVVPKAYSPTSKEQSSAKKTNNILNSKVRHLDRVPPGDLDRVKNKFELFHQLTFYSSVTKSLIVFQITSGASAENVDRIIFNLGFESYDYLLFYPKGDPSEWSKFPWFSKVTSLFLHFDEEDESEEDISQTKEMDKHAKSKKPTKSWMWYWKRYLEPALVWNYEYIVFIHCTADLMREVTISSSIFDITPTQSLSDLKVGFNFDAFITAMKQWNVHIGQPSVFPYPTHPSDVSSASFIYSRTTNFDLKRHLTAMKELSKLPPISLKTLSKSISSLDFAASSKSKSDSETKKIHSTAASAFGGLLYSPGEIFRKVDYLTERIPILAIKPNAWYILWELLPLEDEEWISECEELEDEGIISSISASNQQQKMGYDIHNCICKYIEKYNPDHLRKGPVCALIDASPVFLNLP